MKLEGVSDIPTADTMVYCLNIQSQLCFVEVAWHPWVHGDPNTSPNFWLKNWMEEMQK